MRLLLLSLLLLAVSTARAQPPAAFAGPLLAVSTAEGDRIVLYDVASGGARTLKLGAGDHLVWGFSPDGCRLLFTLDDGSGTRAYTARLDGSDRRELVRYDQARGAWRAWAPQWQPGGDRIALVLVEGEPDSLGIRQHRIAWVPESGGALQFYSATGDEHEPQWSPDGRWLAYISYGRRIPGADVSSTAVPTPQGGNAPLPPPVREADLWLVSADGASKFSLTSFATGSVRAPRWSPDGFLLSFVYAPSPSNEQFWMIAAEPGSLPTQLSAHTSLILDTTWQPDSAALVAAVRDWRPEAQDNRLWTIPLIAPAEAGSRLVVDDPGLMSADYPRFSADGRWLALRSAYALALVDTAAASWTLIEAAGSGNTPPVWSPAGFSGEAGCP